MHRFDPSIEDELAAVDEARKAAQWKRTRKQRLRDRIHAVIAEAEALANDGVVATNEAQLHLEPAQLFLTLSAWNYVITWWTLCIRLLTDSPTHNESRSWRAEFSWLMVVFSQPEA